MKTSTQTLAKARDWQKEYYDSLDSLKSEQRRFEAFEAALKRLISRLCAASLGQSSQVDEQIRKVQAAIRRDTTAEELENICSGLTDAISRIDAPMPAAPRSAPAPTAAAAAAALLPDSPPSCEPPAVIDDRLRAILAALLSQLRRDPDLIVRIDALDSGLAAASTREQLSDTISSINELVAQRIARIEHSKQEIESLLNQMVGKLDEIGRFVASHDQDQSQSRISRESLDAQLMGEMKAMDEGVASDLSVDQLRLQVRGRIDSIGNYLQQFREREMARTHEIRARNEQMRTRVAQLEAEAKRLHHQLNDEQRLSTIDALTNVPNRLAYEKRIEEELHRWQRFQQPICVAVWDIDRFKQVNDKYGHRAGDRVLRAVAESLAGRVRSTDFLARFGGEEFVMIFCGSHLDDVRRISDEMRTAVCELKFHIRGEPIPAVTISCGVTQLRPKDSAESAFDRADKALYEAKRAGRNRCVSG